MKDNGVKAIETLMQKKGKFDYILLETTGLADPGPIGKLLLKIPIRTRVVNVDTNLKSLTQQKS